MKYIPHTYQKAAAEFIKAHDRCLLSLAMGLGKTSITLYAIKDLLEDFAVNRVLIIAPKFVAQDTWVRECRKWDFARELDIAVAVGTEKQRLEAVEGSAQIVTINRENVSWLIKQYKPQYTMINRWPFDMIVIDESSSFKSAGSQRFKQLRKILPHTRRIVELTGTPRPRSVEDLWPQIYLLDSGKRLGKSMTAFRDRYMNPGRRNGYTVYEWKPKAGAEDAIYEAISDISMSMKSSDWLTVPEETTIDHYVTLTTPLRKQYTELCRASILMMNDNAIVGLNAGVLAGKLLQFANGAVYDDQNEVQDLHDLKLEKLSEILESTEEPVMVFYWYKHDYERLKNYFKKYDPDTIHGPADIERWNKGEIRLLLVHPASMGHGLNLQDGGHIIVWFGLTWSLELYQQANARLHRQGQKNRVQIHRIIAEATVDVDVIESLDEKNRGQEALINAIKARIERDL